MPYIKHYKTIFKRFKLKPLYSTNSIVYIYILIKIYIVIKTKGERTLKLLVTTYYP
jgi:plasmid replication initiation protein